MFSFFPFSSADEASEGAQPDSDNAARNLRDPTPISFDWTSISNPCDEIESGDEYSVEDTNVDIKENPVEVDLCDRPAPLHGETEPATEDSRQAESNDADASSDQIRETTAADCATAATANTPRNSEGRDKPSDESHAVAAPYPLATSETKPAASTPAPFTKTKGSRSEPCPDNRKDLLRKEETRADRVLEKNRTIATWARCVEISPVSPRFLLSIVSGRHVVDPEGDVTIALRDADPPFAVWSK